jgi:ethanolaminephosphotransferase
MLFSPITPVGATNLRSYMYKGSDGSVIAPYLYYLWRPMIQVFPSTLSPCVVTTMGMMFSLAAHLLVLQKCDLGESGGGCAHAPRWLFVVVALLMFTYQTFDALDGLQCRRTQV